MTAFFMDGLYDDKRDGFSIEKSLQAGFPDEVQRMNACPFCSIPPGDILDENDYAVAVRDSFPARKGHTLIIARRHVEDYFQLSKEERDKAFELLEKMKKAIDSEFNPDGYNIGFNIGQAGGQTIQHVHIHLIPRKKGDAENCRRGVKGVIRRQMNY